MIMMMMVATKDLTFIVCYAPDTVRNVSSVVFVKDILTTLTDKPYKS